MDTQKRIKTAIERGMAAMELRSTLGRGTAVTKVRLVDGLMCEIEEGSWRLAADMPEKAGGAGNGPNPGVYGRAALGSCLAIGYAMWAARLGVPLASLEVEVHADYDTRAEYGVTDDPPGYRQVRCVVIVESDAAESEVLNLLDQADVHSSYLDIFRRPLDVRREVRITAPKQS